MTKSKRFTFFAIGQRTVQHVVSCFADYLLPHGVIHGSHIRLHIGLMILVVDMFKGLFQLIPIINTLTDMNI